MKFKKLENIMKLKIKKSILNKYSDFDLSLLENSYVNMNNDYDIESIYCKSHELLFENNNLTKINKI